MLTSAEQQLDKRQLELALCTYNAAEAAGAHPDRCAAGRWMIHMLRGDFAAAWHENDRIRARGGPDPHRFWDGQPLAGKRVIVRCLHGFGDTVQFLRYAPLLATAASQVVYEVPPRMLALVPCFEGVTRAITWGDGSPAASPSWDSQIEIMELPYLFRTEVRELPLAERYLRIPASVAQSVQAYLGKKRALRVGLVWTAGAWNTSRALPSWLYACLLENGNLEFWNLQDSASSPADPELAQRLHVYPPSQNSILDLAALIAELDLVITVDTLAAHLAGALGTPVWVLLQHAADWRWMSEGSSSPWYPCMRLFRQPAPDDWQSVLGAVQRALAVWQPQQKRERLK